MIDKSSLEQDFWMATLAKDEDMEGGSVGGVKPTPSISTQSLRMCSNANKKVPLAMIKQSTYNLIRLCVRSVRGRVVDFSDMEGDKLIKVFSMKQLTILEDKFNEWQQPTEAANDTFLGSMVSVSKQEFLEMQKSSTLKNAGTGSKIQS